MGGTMSGSPLGVCSYDEHAPVAAETVHVVTTRCYVLRVRVPGAEVVEGGVTVAEGAECVALAGVLELVTLTVPPGAGAPPHVLEDPHVPAAPACVAPTTGPSAAASVSAAVASSAPAPRRLTPRDLGIDPSATCPPLLRPSASSRRGTHGHVGSRPLPPQLGGAGWDGA